MQRVVHFELPADDPERLAEFYRRVFGWFIEKWSGPAEYWLVTTGPDDQPGINGGIARRAGATPATTNSIDVPSVDEFIARIEGAGGKVVIPKRVVPGVGWLAYCQDTDGNVFAIMQEDASAS